MRSLFKYRRVDNDYVASVIRRELNLSFNQKDEIERILSGYTIIHFVKEKKTNGWMRFTLPFYFLFGIVLLIFACFKWLFTGKFYYNSEGWLLDFVSAWHQKMF